MRLLHVYEAQQFSASLLAQLFALADDIRKFPEKYASVLKGKVLATLFYEPSTRTRLSFESAMLKLGGGVISTENAKEFSSAVKGESLEDTIRIVASYADCIVLRHFEDGAAKLASTVSPVPIINAGDGKGQHPTQALLDTYTMHREFDRVNGLTIAMVGDLASGRTVRSLCYLLANFSNIRLIFVSPDNLCMGDDVKSFCTEKGIQFSEEFDLNKVISQADVIYMTRIQKERITLENYQKARGKFVIDERSLAKVKMTSRIMHPLPHVEEIELPVSVEQHDVRVAYFRQSQNGLYIRMALLVHLLS